MTYIIIYIFNPIIIFCYVQFIIYIYIFDQILNTGPITIILNSLQFPRKLIPITNYST